MHIIDKYNQLNLEQWDALIRRSMTGTWFQSAAAYAFFASQPELFQPFVIAVAQGETLRGVCVGYVTRDVNAFKQHFTRRTVIIGGPALSDNCTHEEVAALMQAVRRNVQDKTIYIETRNFNDYSQWQQAFADAGFAYRKHLNFHVDCSGTNAMWERLSDNRKRQIKKSRAVGVSVADAGSVEEIKEWYAVLEVLYRTKVKTPLFPVEFFIRAYQQGVGAFRLVKYDGRVIGGSMIVAQEGKCVYEWYECGLNNEFKEQYPSVAATFAGLEYAHHHHCSRYDMMGAGEPDVPYGVRDFKAEFGGTLVEHGRYVCVCKPWLYRLGKAGVSLLKRRC